MSNGKWMGLRHSVNEESDKSKVDKNAAPGSVHCLITNGSVINRAKLLQRIHWQK